MLLITGAVVNIAVAWACAAWCAPGAVVSRFTVHQASQAGFRGRTSFHVFGHSRINHGTFVSPYDDVTGTFDISVWVFDGKEHSETQAGWPMRSLRCRNFGEVEMITTTFASAVMKTGLNLIDGGLQLSPFPSGGQSTRWRALPLEPIWAGFVVNTIIHAAFVGLLLAAPLKLRRVRRRRRGLCERCAYPIGTSDVCTECGTTIARMKNSRAA